MLGHLREKWEDHGENPENARKVLGDPGKTIGRIDESIWEQHGKIIGT